jgi:hypothetical protein
VSRILRLIARELRRVGNLRRFARAPRYRLRWPMSVAWGAMLIVSFAALLGLAYLVGHGAAKGDRLLASVEKTIAQPSVSVPLAFAMLTSLAYACRRGRLEWLAWRPGRIQVPDFSAADMDATSQAQLTSLFRERLTRMRLASSGATPAAQPVSDFLDVLSAAEVSTGNVLGTLLGLLRAAVPGFAYELNGVVVKRGAPANDYKVSVQLMRLSSQDGSQIEVTDTDLDRAIQRAADHATAAILPRTHLCKGPWVAWRRYKMPGELFNAYEEACEHEAGKRYDQALEMYCRALDVDPMNWTLRLQLGQLQEKLRMPLEALATYTGLIDAARPANKDLPAGLYSRRAESERRRVWLIARYRRAVMLVDRSTIEAWFQALDERHADRARRLDALRDQLRPWLEKELPLDAPAQLREGLEHPLRFAARQEPLLRVLSQAARRQLDALRSELPLRWSLSRRSPLTRRALKLAALCSQPRAQAGAGVDVERLEEQVKDIERPPWRRPLRPLRRWKEQYNAACLFAIPLLREDLSDADSDRLAAKAVERLELATACAASSFIAGRRDWVTSEDPDLNGLRSHRFYKAFEAKCFPECARPSRRPRGVQELAELRCTRDLLVAAARGLEALWRARAASTQTGAGGEDGHWWNEEQEAWRRIHDVCLHHDSRARLALADASRQWHRSHGIAPVEPVFGRYEERASSANGDRPELIDGLAEREIEEIHDRLLALSHMLARPGDEHGFRGFLAGVTVLEILDGEPNAVTPAMRERLCTRQAVLWHGLHVWLTAPEDADREDLRLAFSGELRRARRLWKRAGMHASLRRMRGLDTA